MIRPLILIALLLLVAASFSARCETVGQPWTGEPGITETVAQIMARAAATPRSKTVQKRHRVLRNTLPESAHPDSAASLSADAGVVPRAAPPITTNFLAVTRNASGALPPDTMGAVGPTQIFVCLNGRFRLFNRSGNAESSLDVDSDVFFESVRKGALTTDPRVHFDRLSNRWFISMLTEATVNRVMLAVSSGPTINDATSFTFFQFQHDFNTTKDDPDHNAFADYDTLGIDPSALYIGVSVFSSIDGFLKGATVFVINKQALLAAKLIITAFRQVSSAGSPGIMTPQGVDNADANATEGYFIGTDNITTDRLNLLRISNPGSGAPTISGTIPISIPNTGRGSLGGVPALGSTQPIDDNDSRLFQAAIRNGSLYTAHNLEVDATGVAKRGGGRDGARWYEIINMTSTPTLRQSGTLFDSATTTPRNFFFPTCAVNGQGHMALGCSVAGAAEHLEIAVTGRLAGDPLGSLQPPVTAVTSTTNYNAETSSETQRWGDYSATVVDPNDNMTFWTFQEYCVMQDVWGVQAIQLQAPPPARPISCTPATIPDTASNLVLTIVGTTSGGAGFYEPGTSFPNHLSATVSGTGCIVNSVTFVDSAHIQLNVTTTHAAAGGRSLSVINPDGQTVASATGLLCIAPPGAPVVAALSASGPLTATVGTPFPFQVSDVDLCGTTVPSYGGTVHFTSSDPNAVLPSPYTFQPNDNGTRMFMASLSRIGDVTLTATDDSFGLSASIVINVSSGPQLTARPAATPNPATAGAPVSCSVSATETLPSTLSYVWDFGDGGTATAQNPAHTFANPGTFNASVTITDASGGMAVASLVVTVTPPPAFISTPSATPNPAGVGQAVQFNAAASAQGNGTLHFSWDFGDGDQSQGPSPVHVFASPGMYIVTVTVTDAGGVTASTVLQLTAISPVVGIGLDSDGDGFSDTFESAFGSDPLNSKSTPLNGLTAGTPLALNLSTLHVQLAFKKTRTDSIMLTGSLPITMGLILSDIKVGVDVSGISHVFKLDQYGRSKEGFTLLVKSSNGAAKATQANFAVRLQKGTFASTLALSGLKNQTVKKVPVLLTVSVVFNGMVFQATKLQSYSATIDQLGIAK